MKNEIKIRVRDLRKARNITQVQLAKTLCVSKQSVSNWENNNILPSVEMLVRIAKYFSVSTDYLLYLDDRKYVETTNLDKKQIAHFQQLMDDVAKNNI
ncbi:helix-turn-helix transcriptional regulator [Candidatus Pseudoruminococcus sp.]|uniref:helix-turn-helix transcriptional regulator n=1 Tax=Candidatus Pseudoruminococcus sp. TaxID=3101048 RepID=UPI00399B2AD1